MTNDAEMTNDPDQIRAEIDRTRKDVGHDVDALAEKVDPKKAVGRKTDQIRDRVSDFRDSVMGSSDSSDGPGMADRASEWADQTSQAMQDAPNKIKRQTRGNPLAAGLIALGAGWLIGSLIPSSRAEQDAAAKVKDRAQPMVEEAKSVAQEAGENLKPQAQEAAQTVKERATEGAQKVKDQGKDRAQQVRDESKRAAQNVKDDAQNS